MIIENGKENPRNDQVADPSCSPLKGQKGFALVITLLVTALLIALTAEFVNEVYVDASASSNFVDGQQASLMATSGIAGGIKIIQLTKGGQPSYTSLLDSWAQPVDFEDEKGKIRIVMEEETGKLNLNYLVQSSGVPYTPYADIAVRLFKKLKLSPDLLDALEDWIDENEEPRPAGAETKYYQGLKTPYTAKNGKLDTLEELRLIRGFDAKTVELLRPYVTVYSDVPNAPAAPININTAPPELIAALDEQMTDSLTEQVLDYRKTTPFKSAGDLAKVAGMETIAQKVATATTVSGGVYRITSVARINETTRTIEATVRVDSSHSNVLYWREF